MKKEEDNCGNRTAVGKRQLGEGKKTAVRKEDGSCGNRTGVGRRQL